MTELEIKFEKLISEMETLIMKKVPLVKMAIIVLENKEKNYGENCYHEIQKKEIELQNLRKI